MHLIIGIVATTCIIFLGLLALYPLVDNAPEPTETKTPEGFFWANVAQMLAYFIWLFVSFSLGVAFALWWY